MHKAFKMMALKTVTMKDACLIMKQKKCTKEPACTAMTN